MSEAGVIRDYYERIVASDFPHLAEIGDNEMRVKAVRREDCHGNSQNLLFFSFKLEGGRLRDLKYECRYCDPTMYVTAELVSEVIGERYGARPRSIDDEDIERALGGKSRRVLRLARGALSLLDDAIAEQIDR